MKSIGSCFDCGQISNLLNDLCSECYAEETSNIKKMKEFLAKNPRANAMEISLGTGIRVSKITRLIKNGVIFNR